VTRVCYAVLLAATVLLGIASRKVHLGLFLWDKSLGDVLYTAAMVVAMGLVAPRAKPGVLAVVAFAVSFAIELFQLTGIPLAIAESPRWGVARWILGTAFAWHDVACYAVGAVAGWVSSRIIATKLVAPKVVAQLAREPEASPPPRS
jgi:hypothetical protein